MICERNHSVLDSSNSVLIRYVSGDGVDEVLTRTIANGPTAGVAEYFTDNQGSMRNLAASNTIVPDEIDYSGFGMTVVEANADGSQWTNTVIAVGKGPEGMDLSPDGKEVWAANSGDGTVSVIDTAAKRVVATVNVGTKHSNRLKFAPDGRVVLISDLGSGELVVMDAPGRKEKKRLKLGRSTEGILIVPDGSRAFVAVSGDNNVAVVDLKTLAVIGTIETGKDPDGMAWRR